MIIFFIFPICLVFFFFLFFQLEVLKMDFSSPSPPMGSGQSPEALMEQVQAQLQQAYAEELIETLRGKCFDKCVTKPGSSLSSGESSCVSRCVDRYIEAMGIVSRSLFSQQRWSTLSSKLLLLFYFCFESESLSLRQSPALVSLYGDITLLHCWRQ